MRREWENQQVHLGEMTHKITILETREEERDVRITLQEDLTQVLVAEVNKLQWKICCCHEGTLVISWGSG